MPITLQDGLDGVGPEDLAGFEMLWVSPERLWRMLAGSELVVLALEGTRVVGYAAAIGDGELFAFLTAIEVLPSHRGQGVGSELIRRLQVRLAGRYAFDLACDEELVSYYERFGFEPGRAMISRNYQAQK